MILDKKLDNLTEAIADAPHSASLLLKLAELEARRDNLTAKLQKPAETRYDALDGVLDDLRDQTLAVLTNEKSSVDDLRTALSMFVSGIRLYPDGAVELSHTIPGFAEVGSELGGLPTAPQREFLFTLKPSFGRGSLFRLFGEVFVRLRFRLRIDSGVKYLFGFL